MRKRFFRILLYTFCGLLSLVLLCLGALVAWVVTGPRSLDAITPYIESAVNEGGSVKVKIGSSLLIWDGITHPVAIRTRNVEVLTATGAPLAHFPEVGVRLYFFKLLLGRLDVKSIELINPAAKLAEDERGRITSFEFSSDSANASTGANESIGAALTLFTSDEGDTPLSHLQSFIIRNASVAVEDSHKQTFLSSPSASLEIKRQGGVAKGKFRMPVQFDGKHSDIDATFTVDGKTRAVESAIVFSEIPSGVLYALAPSEHWMGHVRVPLSGWANMQSDFDANIKNIEFNLEAGQGTIDFPDEFEKPLSLKRIEVSGKLTQGLKLLTIQDGVLDFGTPTISFKGTVLRQGEDVGVDINVSSGETATDDIHRYWPLKLAPHSRHWVTTRLSKGKIVKANTRLHFLPGDFKLKNTPEGAVDSTITVKGVTVIYKPTSPPITGVDGVIKFTGRSMDAKITDAHYLTGTHVTGGRARFPDFYPDDVRMFIEMELATTAKDVQKFLSQPELNKAAKLHLTPEITGDAKGSGKLDFIAFAENSKNEVSATGKINYSVQAELKDITQQRFLGSRDVEGANMKIALDNKGLKAGGKAKINGVAMQIESATSFSQGNETNYAIKADIPVEALPALGLPKLNFASGVIGADATFLSSDTAEKSSATLDLTETAISLPQHGFIKKAGKKATLKLATEQLANGNTLISSFTLKEDAETASGKAQYDKASGDFSSFDFAPLRIGKHDLDSLSYSRSGSMINLFAEGRVFDATPYTNSTDRNMELGYNFDLKADRLIMGPDRELDRINAQVDCPADMCRSAHVTAKLKDGTPFSYVIAGGRLDAACDNAGELVRVLDVFTTMENGKLRLKGEYKGGKLNGMLEIRDYTIKKAPVLTKIITVASLSGLLDTISGKGIYFNRMVAPYVYHRGIVMLKEARAHGDALGLTADGLIDTNKNTMDLAGILVPSYTVNSMVGNIPLIGDLLTGKHGGLVAINYALSGEMKEPGVRVNPLSALTPGFLRNIFDVFDKPAPDMDAIIKEDRKLQAPVPEKPAAPSRPGTGLEEPEKSFSTAVPVEPVEQTSLPALAPASKGPADATPAAPALAPGLALPSMDELKK